MFRANYTGLTIVCVGLEGYHKVSHHGGCEVCDLLSKLLYYALDVRTCGHMCVIGRGGGEG